MPFDSSIGPPSRTVGAAPHDVGALGAFRSARGHGRPRRTGRPARCDGGSRGTSSASSAVTWNSASIVRVVSGAVSAGIDGDMPWDGPLLAFRPANIWPGRCGARSGLAERVAHGTRRLHRPAAVHGADRQRASGRRRGPSGRRRPVRLGQRSPAGNFRRHPQPAGDRVWIGPSLHPGGGPGPGPHQRANRARSAVRSVVEHVFADQKERMALFIRTIGLGRATVKIGIANVAYKFRRLIWLEGRIAPV